MDGDIIDLQAHRAGEDAHFSVFGGEGVGARFALPAWRAASLVGANRAAVLRRFRPEEPPGPRLTLGAPQDLGASAAASEPLEPYFVLDMGAPSTRMDFAPLTVPPGLNPPQVVHGEDAVVVGLGPLGPWDWFMVLDAPGGSVKELTAEERERVLFFAGECAGLLHVAGVADEDPPEPPEDFSPTGPSVV